MNTNKKQAEVDLIINLPVFTEYIDSLFESDVLRSDIVDLLNEKMEDSLDGDTITEADINFDEEDYKERIAQGSTTLVAEKLKEVVETDFELKMIDVYGRHGIRPSVSLKTSFSFFEELYNVIDKLDDSEFEEVSNYVLPYHYNYEVGKQFGKEDFAYTKKYWRGVIDDLVEDVKKGSSEFIAEGRNYERDYGNDIQLLIELVLYISDEYDVYELENDLYENDVLYIDYKIKFSFVDKHPKIMKYLSELHNTK